MEDFKKKIITFDKLLDILPLLNRKGRVVTYNGSFDILHAGHLTSLAEAKQQGEFLIVLVNTDFSIRQYKGPERPIIPERERTQMLAGLTMVDFVVLFDGLNPKEVLSKIRPDV